MHTNNRYNFQYNGNRQLVYVKNGGIGNLVAGHSNVCYVEEDEEEELAAAGSILHTHKDKDIIYTL